MGMFPWQQPMISINVKDRCMKIVIAGINRKIGIIDSILLAYPISNDIAPVAVMLSVLWFGKLLRKITNVENYTAVNSTDNNWISIPNHR